jgi:hypothetical protein
MTKRRRFFSMILGLRFSQHGWSVLRCAVLLTAGSAGIAVTAQQARSGNSGSAHVYVQVDGAGGGGVGFLSKRHFSLSSEGQQQPFAIANVTISRRSGAAVPRNYLLVLPPPFLSEEMKGPCRTFASELKAHWRIRIVDPSGTQAETIPCGTGAARRVIRVLRGAEMDAVKRLGEAHGRRVVLYLTSETHTLQPALQKVANDAGAMVFDVGGHETYFVDEQTYPSYVAPTSQAAMHAGAFAPDGPVPYFVAQPGLARPERSIRSALRDAMYGAQGFYVLTTNLRGPTDVLSLGLKKMPAGLTVAASVSVEEGETPRLEIVQ